MMKLQSDKSSTMVYVSATLLVILVVTNILSLRVVRQEHTMNKQLQGKRQVACQTITALNETVKQLDYQLYSTGRSVTLDRGTVNEHLAYCYDK